MPSSAQLPKVGVQAVIMRDGQVLTVVKQYPEGVAHILPGGGQEHGETLEAAIRRECQEELGTTITVDRLLFVREYIGANHEYALIDAELHIVTILFACQVPIDYQPQLGSDPDPDQISVQWLSIKDLHRYRFYPTALMPFLQQSPMPAVYIGDVN